MTATVRHPRRRVVYCPHCKTRCRFTTHRGDGRVFTFACRSFALKNGKTERRGCDYSVDIKATPEERKILAGETSEMFRGAEAVHKLSHAFQRAFQKTEVVKKGQKPIRIGRKKIWPTRTTWRWKGYELMQRIERFAKKHPEVIVAGVDDDFYAGSCLVFLPHHDEKTGGYHGTSVVYVPQCTGEDPIRFFLYPGHAHEVLEAFKQLRKTYRGVVRKW